MVLDVPSTICYIQMRMAYVGLVGYTYTIDTMVEVSSLAASVTHYTASTLASSSQLIRSPIWPIDQFAQHV